MCGTECIVDIPLLGDVVHVLLGVYTAGNGTNPTEQEVLDYCLGVPTDVSGCRSYSTGRCGIRALTFGLTLTSTGSVSPKF